MYCGYYLLSQSADDGTVPTMHTAKLHCLVAPPHLHAALEIEMYEAQLHWLQFDVRDRNKKT